MSRILAVLIASSLAAAPALAQQVPVPIPEWVRPMRAQPPYTGPRLGVVVLEMSEALRLHHQAPADAGVLVSEVDPGSAAEEAGLEVGDVLIRFDGQLVRTVRELRERVHGAAGGDPVEIEVARKGKWKTLEATIAAPERSETDATPEGWTHRSFEVPGGQGQLWMMGEDVGELHERLTDLETEMEELRHRLEELEEH